jgi:serine/threonine protein kinase
MEFQIPFTKIDAYGITLLELLTKQNPFFGKSKDEIIALHDTKDFGIEKLPNWQQEIILKAIAIQPEQRFQSMKDFNEAIQAQAVPIIFDKEAIQAGEWAEKAKRMLDRKNGLKHIPSYNMPKPT